MKDKNLKRGFLSNAKSRTILVIVAVIVLGVGGVYAWQKVAGGNQMNGAASIVGTPRIESIPGAGNPTTQYVKQQDLENVKKAEAARVAGTSSVPTINRGSFVGSLDTFGKLPVTQCPIDPQSLPAADPNSCTVDSLQRARSAGVRVLELRCKGCTCPSLKMAGYTVGDLKTAGFDAKSLRDCGFTLAELKAAGFSAAELKAAGFTAAELRQAGFTAAQLQAAGFSAAELLAAGYSPAEIKAAGFSADELKAVGLGTTPIIPAITNKDCSPEELRKARNAGVSAQMLKDKGCGAAALKAAGYTAGELRAAGFSAKELKDAGFSAAELKAAGYSASDLKNAGFSAAELRAAGFSAADLKAAGFSAKELKDAGFSAKELKDAGFSAADLKDAGFTAGQLKEAGFSAAELSAAGFSNDALRKAGFAAEELKDAGVSPDELAAVGYTKGDLLRAGFTPTEAGYVQSLPQASAPSLTVNPAAAASAMMPKIGNSQSPEEQLAAIERIQQSRMSRQQRQDMVMQQQGAMALQATKLLGGWSNFAQQSSQAALPETPATSAGNFPAGSAGAGANAAGGEIVKAGSIMFAVLDTSINSDEKGTPIMARIVGGPYKGGKLLGQFSLVDKRLMLTFNLLNLPDRDKSIPIKAVAIDPDTARTAMEGEINNHYLLRYGTFFASAFLAGVADALQNSGATTQTTTLGTVTVQKDLSLAQSALVGAGAVGKKFSDVLGQTVNMPPTVKIASGTGMGLLFMNDTTIPGSQS